LSERVATRLVNAACYSSISLVANRRMADRHTISDAEPEKSWHGNAERIFHIKA
jgi:hypothetical protein